MSLHLRLEYDPRTGHCTSCKAHAIFFHEAKHCPHRAHHIQGVDEPTGWLPPAHVQRRRLADSEEIEAWESVTGRAR